MPSPHPLAHKLSAVKRVRHLIEQNKLSEKAACRRAGVPRASFQAWEARLQARGEAGLAADFSNCGRKPKWELDADEVRTLRGLVLIHDSRAYAIETFARHHECCRHETREAILNELDLAAMEKRYPRWPVSLQRAACITVENKKLFRGGRAFDTVSFSPVKGLFIVLEDGTRVDLLPHTAWVMDDYDTNEPYAIETGLCRQVLACMDVACDSWLGMDMIGRERNAYRAEDILRFVLRCIEGQQTMPEYLLLERGRWDSEAVHGLHLGKSREQGGLGSRFDGVMWGGLDALFRIIHGFSPRHKASLESSFNILQTILAHSGTSIGRHRGEFEQQTKRYLQVKSGTRSAEQCGFLSQPMAAEAHWRACQIMNGRGRHRSATGTVEIPDTLMGMFHESMQRPLPVQERWRFLPVKKRCTVRGGFVEITLKHYGPLPFRFQINGRPEGGDLPTGYTLLVAFDPAMPALGAYIANGEAGPLNREALPIGQFLFTATHYAQVPMIDLRPGGYGESDKKRANAAARTDFKSINPLGRRGLAVTQRHDGQGNAAIARTGGAAAPLLPTPRDFTEAEAAHEFPERATALVSEEEVHLQRGGVRVDLAALESAAHDALDGL